MSQEVSKEAGGTEHQESSWWKYFPAAVKGASPRPALKAAAAGEADRPGACPVPSKPTLGTSKHWGGAGGNDRRSANFLAKKF